MTPAFPAFCTKQFTSICRAELHFFHNTSCTIAVFLSFLLVSLSACGSSSQNNLDNPNKAENGLQTQPQVSDTAGSDGMVGFTTIDFAIVQSQVSPQTGYPAQNGPAEVLTAAGIFQPYVEESNSVATQASPQLSAAEATAEPNAPNTNGIVPAIENGPSESSSLEVETPEVETPEVETPEVETPEVETPEVETPEVETPEVETPEVETPEVETPEVETPGVETPEVETPEVETPEVETPEVETPEVETPEVETPEVETPEVETPEVETPEVETPEVETPGVETPGVETPGVETPGVDTPGVDTPGVETPGVETPGVETPGVETPGVDTPGVDTPEAASYLLGRTFSNWYVGNLTIGNGYNYRPTFPFLADTSADIESIKVYWVWDFSVQGTYSSGNGGTIRIDIVKDLDNRPGDDVIASGVFSPNLNYTNSTSDWSDPGYQSNFRNNLLNSFEPTTKGHKYWVVFTNVAADPDNNYISINGLAGRVGNETPFGYFGSQDDPSVEEGHLWYLWDDNGHDQFWDGHHEAIRQINYSDQTTEGFAIIGGRYTDVHQNRIQGNHQVRQTIVPEHDNVIHNANLMVGRHYGNGSLTLRIIDEFGQVLASDTIASSQVSQTYGDAAYGDGLYGHTWVQFPDINGFKLLKGNTYYAVLSAPDDTEYYSYGGQIGSVNSRYAFDPNILDFKGQIAEHSDDGGSTWTGWHHNGSTVKDTALPLYFNKGYPRAE